MNHRKIRTIEAISAALVIHVSVSGEIPPASLDEAEGLGVGNAQLLDRIQQMREALKQKGESPSQP